MSNSGRFHPGRSAGAILGMALLLASLAVAPTAIGSTGEAAVPPGKAEYNPGELYKDQPVKWFFLHQIALPSLLLGAQNTLLLTLTSMPLAVIFGVFLALARRSHHRFMSWPAATYIEIMRGTPLLVQIYVVFFSLPLMGQALNTDLLTLSAFTTGIICLSANYAAYEAEIIRAGIEAVDRGQREAALSLGLSERKAFFLVVMPQAFRIVIPPLINDLIAMLKDSCLVSVVGVRELLGRAQSVGLHRGTTGQMLLAAAVIYLAMSLACYFFGRWLEKRLKVKGGHELHLEQPHGH